MPTARTLAIATDGPRCIKGFDLKRTLVGPSGFVMGEGEGEIAGLDDTANPHVKAVKGVYMPVEGNAKTSRTSDACVGCHDQRNNGHNVPLCQTCHMSVTNKLADPSMGGGHSEAMAKALPENLRVPQKFAHAEARL